MSTIRAALTRLLACPDLNCDSLELETIAAIRAATDALATESAERVMKNLNTYLPGWRIDPQTFVIHNPRQGGGIVRIDPRTGAARLDLHAPYKGQSLAADDLDQLCCRFAVHAINDEDSVYTGE